LIKQENKEYSKILKNRSIDIENYTVKNMIKDCKSAYKKATHIWKVACIIVKSCIEKEINI